MAIKNKKLKVLLIRPYFEMLRSELGFLPFEPLGIMYLKSAVLDAGHEAEIYDCLIEHPQQIKFIKDRNVYRCGSSDRQITKKIRQYRPDVIGISGMFYSQTDSFNHLAELAKLARPEAIVVGGGAFPSSYGSKILSENKNLDVIVSGEGEITFVELINNLADFTAVNGIFYRDKQADEIIENPPRSINCRLDQLRLPSRNFSKIYDYSKPIGYNFSETFNLKKFLKRKIFYTSLSLPIIKTLFAKAFNWQHRHSVKALFMPHGFIITSRGCPQRCTFCAIHKVWGQNYRMRSAASVIEEIMLLASKGVKEIVIVDDNFTVSKQRTLDICRAIIDSKYELRLMAPSGVYIPTLDEEILSHLYLAGLRELNFGIENGDQSFLNRVIRKNLDLDQARKTITLAKKIGLRTIAFLMFGYPGETKETMLATLRFAFESGVDSARFYVFQPFPNTEAFKMAVDMGAINEDLDFLRLKAMTDKPQLNTDQFTSTDVKKIYDLAYEILRKRNYNEVKNDLKSALGWD